MFKKKILLIIPLLFVGILVCLILGGKNQKIFSGELNHQLEKEEKEIDIEGIRKNIENMDQEEIDIAIKKVEKEISRLERKLEYAN